MSSEPNTGKTAIFVYTLYFMALVFSGIPAVVGVIIAYANRSGAPDWVRSHYQYQIRTFWISAALVVIGVVLMVMGSSGSKDEGGALVVIGLLALVASVIWLVVRCFKGLKQVKLGQPVA